MAIVNHTLETSAQANGSTHYVLRMFDQDGVECMVSFFAQSADVTSLIEAKISATNLQLSEYEFEQIVGAE